MLALRPIKSSCRNMSDDDNGQVDEDATAWREVIRQAVMARSRKRKRRKPKSQPVIPSGSDDPAQDTG